jgi:hypothetical protein
VSMEPVRESVSTGKKKSEGRAYRTAIEAGDWSRSIYLPYVYVKAHERGIAHIRKTCMVSTKTEMMTESTEILSD